MSIRQTVVLALSPTGLLKTVFHLQCSILENQNVSVRMAITQNISQSSHLLMRKLRPKKEEELALSHTKNEWRRTRP